MRVFQADELTRLEGAQEAAMMDSCTVYELQDGVLDSYGKPAKGWIPLETATEIACGLNTNKHVEVLDGAQVAITDAVLRLAIGTPVTHLSRIRVTKRYGSPLATALEYAVIGEPRQGASGLVLALRTLDDGGSLG